MNTLIKLTEKRSYLTQKIRDFFVNNGFLEVETPIMTPIPGMEPHLTPFETVLHNPQHITEQDAQNPQKPGNSSPLSSASSLSPTPLFLNTSPELQMKKLLGYGFPDIFNITKVFRDTEINGLQHNPEFTMIEWYRKNSDYFDLMQDCEQMILYLTEDKNINYQNQKIDLTTRPWQKITTNELFQKFCDIDLLQNKTFKKFQKTANQKNLDINGCQDWDDIFFKIFLNHIEPNLPKDRPVFVYDYPATQAALAKTRPEEPFFAERFELYISGIEIANAFSELIDAKEQKARLQEEQQIRKKLNKTIFDIDSEFLSCLESITTPCSGIALGIDRLFMLLLDKTDIADVLLFPLNTMLNHKNHAHHHRHPTRNRHQLQRRLLADSPGTIRQPW